MTTIQRQYFFSRVTETGVERCRGWMRDDSRLQPGTQLTLVGEGVDPEHIWVIEERSQMTRQKPTRRRVWDIDI